MKKKEVINRKQFLSKLGLGTGAIMATYCLGSLSSCDDEDDDYYMEEDSDDDIEVNSVEEQSNLSRVLQYVVQRARNGNDEQQNGLTPEQIQALLARIVASAENENEEDLEIDEDDVDEVVE